MCGEVSSVQKWMKLQMYFWLERQSIEKFHSLLHFFFFSCQVDIRSSQVFVR